LRIALLVLAQRATHVHLILELPFLIAANVPLVAFVWFDDFPVLRHLGLHQLGAE
jgi:hypothetical protein